MADYAQNGHLKNGCWVAVMVYGKQVVIGYNKTGNDIINREFETPEKAFEFYKAWCRKHLTDSDF